MASDGNNLPAEKGVEPAQKTRRGPTYLDKVNHRRKSGTKILVTLDKGGKIRDPKVRAEYKSYLGVLARSYIPININDWRSVPATVKDKIWDEALLVYDGIEDMKRSSMKTVNRQWRQFKSFLYCKYILGEGLQEGEETVLVRYKSITEEAWDQFVEYRNTAEFAEYSAKQKTLRKKNVHTHTMSRGGYPLLEDKIVAEMRKDREEDQSVISDAELPLDPVPRHVLWKRGRISKAGKFTTPATEEVARRIDDIESQLSEGTFTPSDRHDILAEALQTPEHGGRVRGKGGDCTWTSYFGPKNKRGRFFSSQEEIDRLVSLRVTEQLKKAMEEQERRFAETQREMREQIQKDVEKTLALHKLGAPVSSEPTGHQTPHAISTKESGHPSFPNLPLDGKKCLLSVLKANEPHVAAIGRAFPGSSIHSTQLDQSHVKATVDEVIDGECPVPVPTAEISKVKEALKGFVAWPKTLVDFNIQGYDAALPLKKQPKTPSEGVASSKIPDAAKDMEFYRKLPRTCRRLYMRLEAIPELLEIPFPSNLSGATQGIDVLLVSVEDIRELLEKNWLNTSCIELYIRFLTMKVRPQMPKWGFCFLNPSLMRYMHSDPEGQRVEYLARRVVGNLDKPCHFIPYIRAEGGKGHWTLVVLFPNKGQALWLDPLRNAIEPDFRKIVTEGYQRLVLMAKSRSPRVDLPTSLKWTALKNNPKQEGGWECGYYVMLYMKEIIDHYVGGGKQSIGERFKMRGPSYTPQDIDELREDWAEYLLEWLNGM